MVYHDSLATYGTAYPVTERLTGLAFLDRGREGKGRRGDGDQTAKAAEGEGPRGGELEAGNGRGGDQACSQQLDERRRMHFEKNPC